MSTTRALRVACMLLLVTQVTCDWVEIEQDHYKPYGKPKINSNLRASNAAPQHDETTKYVAADNKYNEDKKWSKAVVNRISNVGNIRRVLTPSVKTTSIKRDHADNIFRKNVPDTGEAGDRLKPRDYTTSPRRHYFTERPNVLSFRPTQGNLDRLKSVPNSYERVTEKDISVNSNIFNGNNVQIFNEQHSKYNEDKKNILQNDSIQDVFDKNFEIVKFGHTRTSPRPSIGRRATITSRIKILHREQTGEGHMMQNFNHEHNKYSNSSISISSTPGRITQIDTYIASEKPTTFKVLHTNPYIKRSDNIPSEMGEDEELPIEDQPTRTTEEATKDKKMDGMLKLMKVVSDIIYKNTHRSFKGKVRYLEGLKSTLLTTIEEHIDRVWPDDADRSRRVREARGHLELPSSESALMTISFLTFAVFLIKLVLQVIHTYKNKTMMVTPTVVAAVGRVAKAMRSKG